MPIRYGVILSGFQPALSKPYAMQAEILVGGGLPETPAIPEECEPKLRRDPIQKGGLLLVAASERSRTTTLASLAAYDPLSGARGTPSLEGVACRLFNEPHPLHQA